jgi:hypothetical protein
MSQQCAHRGRRVRRRAKVGALPDDLYAYAGAQQTLPTGHAFKFCLSDWAGVKWRARRDSNS